MSKPIKAVLGLAAMVVLLFVVLGYWNQYRHAADRVANTQAPAGYESTTSPTKSATKTSSSKKSGTKQASTTKSESSAPKKGDKIVTVLIQGLNFRESADRNANVIRGLDEGEVVLWLETQDSWYKVKDAQGVEGYITSSDQYAKLGTQK